MKKDFIKEIIIVLLLALAIILILGVLLYEYVPINKMIPEKVSYTTPEEAKNELKINVEESDEELYIDYHIDSTELNNYKKIQEYVPGKKNPFATLEKPAEDISNSTTNNVSDGTGNNGSSSTSNTQSTNVEDKDSGYLPDKGTK